MLPEEEIGKVEYLDSEDVVICLLKVEEIIFIVCLIVVNIIF